MELDAADLAMLGLSAAPAAGGHGKGGGKKGKDWRARNREKRLRRPRRKGDRPADPYGVHHDALIAGLASEERREGGAGVGAVRTSGAAKVKRNAASKNEDYTRPTFAGIAPADDA
uniref:Uncharacterized protein n=1 Tax=Bicosoecida sp. CB-2014 TaxID=1486930 RepID=A0A7S1C875_9STRA